MNSQSFFRNVRRIVASLILFTLLFPASLGTTVGTNSVKAASLPQRVVYTPSADVLNISGVSNDGEPDYFTIRRNSDGSYTITVTGLPGNIIAVLGLGGRINFYGSTDNDTLTVDFSGGSPIPGGGLNFEAAHHSTFPGASDLDTLILSGGNVSSLNYSFTDLKDGTVEIDGGTLIFSHLEPIIDLVPSATLTVNGTAAHNAITYGPGGAGNGKVAIDNYETIEFSNKTSLVINAGSGDDTILLDNNTTPTGLTGITVNGELGEDRLTVANTPGAGSTLAAINLNGGGQDDTFLVRPSDAAVVNVDGGDHLLGNSLFVDTLGLTATDNGSSVQVAAYQLINYVNIQYLRLLGAADLSVSLAPAAPTVVAGGTATFNASVHNAGPAASQNAIFKALLPAAFVDGSLEVTGLSQGNCLTGTPGESLDPLLCNFGDMAPGATLTFQIVVDIDPAFFVTQPTTPASDNIDLDAWVSSDGFDPDLGDNLASTFINVTESADLYLRKFAVGSPVAGQQIHYEYQIQNLGPSVSRNVMLRDFLPSQVQFVSAFVDYSGLGPVALPCNLTAGSNVLFCPLGDLPKSGSLPVMVFVNVLIKPGATGTLTNSADVNLRDTPDPVTTNNSASVVVNVQRRADLSITKTSEPAKVVAGEQVKYTLLVTNHGPSTALEVLATDTFTQGISYETGPTFCEQVGSAPDVVECDLGDLQPGQTQTIELHARIAADVPTGENLENNAAVESDTIDPQSENNTASAFTYIEGVADLRVTKFGKPDNQVRAGTPLTYTIVVDNFGPSYAHEVTILDQIVSSGGFQLLDLQSDRAADCDPPGPYASLGITCVLSDTLEPASVGDVGRWIVTAVVIANEPGSINNLARVSGSDLDPDLSNNEAKVEHEITAVVDLSVTKTAMGEVMVNGELLQWGDPWPWGLEYLWPDLPMGSWVNDGRVLTYTLTITNNGPSTAQNIVVKDYLPEGVAPPGLPLTSTLPIDFVVKRVNVLPPSTGSCLWGVLGDPSTPLECNLDSLPGGEAARIQVVISIPKGVPVGTYYYNRVRVYNDLFDPLNGNNFDDLFTVVVPPIWLNFMPVINAFISWP